MTTIRRPALVVLALIGVFVLACLPLLPTFAKYEGDERYYSDAAWRMVESGDYITPYYDDGRPRFIKPVLHYWVLAASYRLGGFNVVATHVPGVIFGALLIGLTYVTARGLFGRDDVGVLAAAIMMSNRNLFSTALRARPDLLLTLFLMLSLYGFVRLLILRDTRRGSYAGAWLGAGLAAATKGLSGFLPAGYSGLFCLGRRGRTQRARRLVHAGFVAASLVIALFWYAAIFARHGTPALKDFWNDQVGTKVTQSSSRVFSNAEKYLETPLRHFLPWTLLLIPLVYTAHGRVRCFLRANREACFYCLGWFLLIILTFLWGATRRSRYLMPAYPLLPCLLAGMLTSGLDDARAARAMRRWLHALALLVGLIAGAGLIAAGVRVDMRLATCGVLWIALAVGYVLATRRRSVLTALLGAAAITSLILASYEFFITPVLSISPAAALAAQLEARRVDERVAIVCYKSETEDFTGLVGEIRLLSHGRLHVDIVPLDVSPNRLADYNAAISPAKFTDQLKAAGYEVEANARGFERDLKPPQLLRAALARDPQAALAAQDVTYYLATRARSGTTGPRSQPPAAELGR